MPDDRETIPQLASVTKGVIGYEGIIRKSSYEKHANLKDPVALGDGSLWVPDKNPQESQFSVYGSTHAGIYPSYLYYNSYAAIKTVVINIESKTQVDIYNTVSQSFVVRNVTAPTKIKIEGKHAAVIVIVPTKGKSVTMETK